MSKKGRFKQKRFESRGPSARRQAARRNDPPNGVRQQSSTHSTLCDIAASHSIRLTAECISDIAVSISRVNELAATRRLTPRVFQRECRNISVCIRKLILPGGGDLLKQCFTPAMHSLRRPANAGLGDTLSQWIGNIELTYSVGDSTETREITVPSEHTHATVINPLYGLRRTGDLTFRLDELVDWSSTPIRCSQRLKAKVLQIDYLTMTAETLLRTMANNDGQQGRCARRTE